MSIDVMSSLSSTHTDSSEHTQLNPASDTVHEEANYSSEYSRTHGEPASQRDPTMFPKTDQDNVVDMPANNNNTGTTDSQPQSKSIEHADNHEKTGNHSPTRRKSFTNQAHNNRNDHSNTQVKTVHHSPTRRKSITQDAQAKTTTASAHADAHAKATTHSPTRRKSITHDIHKDTSDQSNAQGKTVHHSPTRRKSITHDAHADSHRKTTTHSPTRRNSTTQQNHKDSSEKTVHHSPTRRKSITHDAHGARRKSNAHEHEKDQLPKTEKIEYNDLVIANTGAPTQPTTDASAIENNQAQ